MSIFEFIDYREFMKAKLQKLSGSLSLRKIASKMDVTPAYLSMVVSGKRNLESILIKEFGTIIGLSEYEIEFFTYLISFNDSKDIEIKKKAFKKLLEFQKFKRKYQKDLSSYKYLTHWYYVAIREMTSLDDFIDDPKWIKRKLGNKVKVSEIRAALKFLIKNNLIKYNVELGRWKSSGSLDCSKGIYKLSMAQFHQQMLGQVIDSIYDVDSTQRMVLSHTVAINEDSFHKVNKAIESVLKDIQQIGNEEQSRDRVYQVSFANVPLTLKEVV